MILKNINYQSIINKWNELDALLEGMQLKDSSTPGLRKEIQIAHILGHRVHQTKHGPDAYNPKNDNEKFEYLCAQIGGRVQLDRIDLSNVSTRIGKNDKIYAAFFVENIVSRIYEIDTSILLMSAISKICDGIEYAKSKNKLWTSKHIGWSEDEIIKLNSKKLYEKI